MYISKAVNRNELQMVHFRCFFKYVSLILNISLYHNLILTPVLRLFMIYLSYLRKSVQV